MGRKEEILAEIRRLTDGQLEMLKGKLTQQQAVEYILRKNEIDELLQEINRDGFGKSWSPSFEL
jgi:hypothetical protein